MVFNREWWTIQWGLQYGKLDLRGFPLSMTLCDGNWELGPLVETLRFYFFIQQKQSIITCIWFICYVINYISEQKTEFKKIPYSHSSILLLKWFERKLDVSDFKRIWPMMGDFSQSQSSSQCWRSNWLFYKWLNSRNSCSRSCNSNTINICIHCKAI